MKGLIVVPPVAMTDAMLTDTDVPEADHPVWSNATTYALGARVIVTTGRHRIYESLQASNTNHDPATSSTWWVDVGPTNRWALFDRSNSTQTAQANAMSYEVQLAGAINAVSALNVAGANSVRVQLIHPVLGSIYDVTTELASLPAEPGWWQWFFGTRTAPTVLLATDLPGIPGCRLLVDFAGTTDLAVGVLLFGELRELGSTVLAGARVSLQDYSRKETNAFGDTVLVQRAFAKRATFALLIPAAQVDATFDYLAPLRATPCLWIGSSRYAATVVYGWYRDLEVSIAYANHSDCNLQIEGLT